MSELLSSMWSAEMQGVLIILAVALIALYVLSIVWFARDAYARGTVWMVWMVVAIIPLVGVIAYLLLRPPLLQIDRDEQELEVALKQRQLGQYGNCSNCGYPVEADYLLCPNCHQRLKNQCPTCGRALDPAWSVCPYCGSPSGVATASRGGRPRSAAPASQQGRVTSRPASSQQQGQQSQQAGRTAAHPSAERRSAAPRQQR